jgi:hypothetical protein
MKNRKKISNKRLIFSGSAVTIGIVTNCLGNKLPNGGKTKWLRKK